MVLTSSMESSDEPYRFFSGNERKNTNKEMFDQVVAHFTRLVDGRKKLEYLEKVYILNELGYERELNGMPNEGDVLSAKGNGIYFAEKETTFEFFDGTPGLSGYFVGLTIEELPLYEDLMRKNYAEIEHAPVLCVALSDYSLHNSDNTPGIFIDDIAIVPLHGQQLKIDVINEDIAA